MARELTEKELRQLKIKRLREKADKARLAGGSTTLIGGEVYNPSASEPDEFVEELKSRVKDAVPDNYDPEYEKHKALVKPYDSDVEELLKRGKKVWRVGEGEGPKGKEEARDKSFLPTMPEKTKDKYKDKDFKSSYDFSKTPDKQDFKDKEEPNKPPKKKDSNKISQPDKEEPAAKRDSGDDEFAKSLAEAEKAYSDREGQLDRRELAETIGNALGKIGGGMIGKKTGADMSGAQFDKKNWDAKRDRNLRRYMADKGTVSERRQAAAQQSRHEDTMSMGKEDLNLKKQGMKLNAITSAMDDATKRAKLQATLNEQERKNIIEARDKVKSLMEENSGIVDSDKETSSEIVNILVNDLGISLPDAKAAVRYDKGFLSDNMANVDEINNAITKAVVLKNNIFVKNKKTGKVDIIPREHADVFKDNPEWQIVQ